MNDIEQEQFSFSQLVDVAAFTKLLESFFKATGIPNGLVGPEGELISQAGWTITCADFHRVHPETQKRCQQSNIELMSDLHDGQVSGCLCANGLLDYATPIVIEGHQLATLFLGQVLNEAPDLAQFRKQAEQFGFDEEAYLDAIRAVPIISRERLEAHMDHMVEVAQVLAMTGLARLREQRLQKSLEESTEKQIQAQDLLDNAPIGIGWSDADGTVEYVNQRFTELFGYTFDDLPDLESWYRCAYPDPAYREEVVEPWQKAVAQAHEAGSQPPELEADITCKDGSVRRVLIHVSWVGNKRLVNFSDITEHWKSEKRNRTHEAILDMVARAKPLGEILNAIVNGIEAESSDSLCSILLLDADGKYLMTGAAPRLPDFYNQAVNGLEIGMGVGSCGTAAFTGKRVIVENIATHEYWCSAAELAQKAGLGACWSEPIKGSGGKVLGTFATYHRKPAAPSDEDIERIAFAANITGVAIESHNTRESLQAREREFRSLAENAPDNIARYNTKAQLIYMNPRLAKTLGDKADQMLGKHPCEHVEDGRYDLYEANVKRVLESGESLEMELETTTPEGKVFHLVRMVAERDESDAISGVLAIGRNITERKQMQARMELLEKAVNRSGDAIHLVDAETLRFSYVNDAFCRHLGYSRDELPRMTPADIDPDISTADLREIVKRLRAGEHIVFETRHQHRNGELLDVELSLSLLHYADRDYALAIARDISESKQMEKELEASEQLFRSLAESSPDYIIRYDLEHRIRYMNEHLASLLKLDCADDAIGKRPIEIWPDGRFAAIDEAAVRVIASGSPETIEMQGDPSAGYFVSQIIIVPERDIEGDIIGTLAVGRDITERKQMEKRLAQREEQFRTLAENAPDNIARHDCEGRILYVNPVLERTVGIPLDQLRGKTLYEAIPSEEHQKYVDAVCQVAAARESLTIELPVPDDVGGMGVHMIHMSPELNDAGESVAVLAIGRDITKLKSLEQELAKRELQFRTLAENAPVNIARYDIEGRLIYLNPRLEMILGAETGEILGLRPTEHLDHFEDYEAHLMHVASTGGEVTFELEVPHEDGVMNYLIHMVAECDKNGDIVTVLAIGRDISELKRMEQKLALREREFRTLAENAPIKIARYDSDARLTYMNERLGDLFPVTPDDVLGKRPTEMAPLTFLARFEKAVKRTLKSGKECAFESKVHVKDGSVRTYLVNMVAEHDKAGAIIGVLATGLDITERKQMERELERQANFDALTGLVNRRHFLEKAESEIARSKRYGGELSLIMFDIDHFKRVNDTHGHHVGDQVLRHVAETTRNCIRNIDIAGRIGGEEFVILLPQTDLDHAAEAAERLRTAMETSEIVLENGSHLIVTVSLGVVTQCDRSDALDELLKRADTAMYQAKQNGRNRLSVFEG